MSDDENKLSIDPAGAAQTPTEPAQATKPAAKKAPTKKAAPKKSATGPSKGDSTKRVWIILAKNPDIPPSGLFIGHNGVGYNLKAGKKASVPEFLLDVLDNAVVKRPVVGDNGRITGYEDSPRFPYQVVREK